MADLLSRLRRFFRELKRRNVYRVAVTYIVVAFVGLEAADLLVPQTTLPAWSEQLLIYLAVFGFPIALVLAWAFEMTPEGVRRTPAEEAEAAQPSGSSAAGWVVALLVVLLAGGAWYLTAGGTEESPETAASADTARGGAASTATRASRDRPFVAVLPLENLSPKEKNQFFADGVHEEILTQLSKVSGLGVYGRTTMEQYAEREPTIYEIGQELGAEAVLEGSVRRAAGRVRISVQLIDPDSRDHLWSETYERELSPKQIFDIQADIAEKVAAALETKLTEEERRRIEEAPTDDLAAYDAYLRGIDEWVQIWASGDLAHLDRAIEHLREAVRRDPSFGEAHARLSGTFRTRYQFTQESRWLDSAAAALERGQELAPNSAPVYSARSSLLQARDSLDAAEETLRQGLELHPSNTGLTIALSKLLEHQGEWAKAIRWYQRVLGLDPQVIVTNRDLAQAFTKLGMMDAAEAWLQRTQDLASAAWWPVAPRVRLQLARGQTQKARETVAAFHEDHPDHTGALALAAEVALYAGDAKQAKAYLERAAQAPPRSLVEDSPAWRAQFGMDRHLGWAELRLGNRERGEHLLGEAIASIRAELDRGGKGRRAQQRAYLAAALSALGQTEEALRQLERSAEMGFPAAEWLRVYPLFEPIRPAPRFQEVVERVEANQQGIRDQVRQVGIDLYPPGTEPDSTSVTAEAASDG